MGFADLLRDNTPSEDQVYESQLNHVIEEVMYSCKSASEKGNRRYSSYGQSIGIAAKFPRGLSLRQEKNLGKKMSKDIKDILLQEGFKIVDCEVRQIVNDNAFENRIMYFDVSCNW